MLRAIFYSEFDNDVGPQVAYQYPEGYLSADVFDGVSDYIITKPQLCGKIVTIVTSGHKIVGYPLRVRNERYHRYALMFNVGLVFNAGADTSAYEGVLRKLGNTLHTMETESSFLINTATKSQLREYLPAIMDGLLSFGQVCLPIDDVHTLFLRIFKPMPPPALVAEHEVPVFVKPFPASLSKSCDLTLQLVMPHVDGVNYVRRIADITSVAVDLVQLAIRQLLYFGYVAIIDIFQYSNVYATTPRISELARNMALQKACVAYVAKSKPERGRKGGTFATLFQLYAAFHGGDSVRDLCTTHKLRQLRIDDRRFVAFGVIHGFLRRVHEYPVPLLPLSELLQLQQPARARGRANGLRHDSAAVDAQDGAGQGIGSGAGGLATSGRHVHTRGPSVVSTDGGRTSAAAPEAPKSDTAASTRAPRPAGSTDAEAARHGTTTPPPPPTAAANAGGAPDSPASPAFRPIAQTSPPGPAYGQPSVPPHTSSSVRLLKLCDGTRNVDQICCTLLRSRGEVMKEIESNQHFVVVKK